MNRKDFGTAVVLGLFGLAVIIESLRMPRLAPDFYYAPGFVPLLIGSVLLLCAVLMLVRSVRAKTAGVPGEEVPAPERRAGNRRFVITLILGAVYAGVFVGRIPFWLATFLFIVAFMLIFEVRRSDPRPVLLRKGGFAVALALVASTAVVWLFQNVFLIRLP